VRDDEPTFGLGVLEVGGGVDDGGQRGGLGAGYFPLCRSERGQARRVDDLVCIAEPAFGGGVLGKAQRQDAETAGRKPHQPRTGSDARLFQARVQAGA
jgi:hypothetical protein